MPNTMVFNSVRFVRKKKNLMSEIRDLPADQIEDKISRQYEYVSVIEQLLSFNESKKDDYDMYVEVWQDQEKEILIGLKQFRLIRSLSI